MIVILHIVVALIGVILATSIMLKPSHTKLRLTTLSASLTLISGTFLVLSTGSNLLKACLSGLAYFGFVGLAILYSNKRLNTN